MFSELSKRDLIDTFKNNHNLVITLTNYEERSVALLEELAKECVIAPSQLSLCRLELTSATYKIDMLGAWKRIHREQLDRLGFQANVCPLEYPGSSGLSELRWTVQTFIRACEEDRFNIVVDISCLPRALMFGLLDAVYDEAIWNELGKRVERIIVVYTAAGSYPKSRYAQVIGTPVGCFSNQEIGRILRDKDSIEAMIFPGFEGFGSAAVYEALTRSGIQSKARLVFLLDGANFIRAQRSMIANQLLIHLASQRQDTFIDYCFSYFSTM